MEIESYYHCVIGTPELVLEIVGADVREISFLHLFLTPVQIVLHGLLESEHHRLSRRHHDATVTPLVHTRVVEIHSDPAEPAFIRVVTDVDTEGDHEHVVVLTLTGGVVLLSVLNQAVLGVGLSILFVGEFGVIVFVQNLMFHVNTLAQQYILGICMLLLLFATLNVG